VSGQLHAPAELPLGKRSRYPLDERLCAPEIPFEIRKQPVHAMPQVPPTIINKSENQDSSVIQICLHYLDCETA
jgi:hypothetical protein